MLREILESLNRETLNQLDLVKRGLSHPGESGRARENIIRDFLSKVCPQDLGLSTGFVVDACGAKSKQIDIVVYRREYYPTLEVGGIKHFMVESVLAVIENKASIASEQTLLQALENIRSVKRLDRTNRNKNYSVVGNERVARPFNACDFRDQIFGVIVTEESLGLETFNTVMKQFFQQNERQYWPNLYVDTRNFIATYGLKRERPLSDSARSASVERDEPGAATIVTTDPNVAHSFGRISGGTTSPLSDLGFELVNFLRIASKVDFSPSDYLSLPYTSFSDWDV